MSRRDVRAVLAPLDEEQAAVRANEREEAARLLERAGVAYYCAGREYVVAACRTLGEWDAAVARPRLREAADA